MKKVFGIILALALALSMTVMAIPAGAAISNITVTQSNPITGALSTYNITFTMEQPLDGTMFEGIDITFPAGTDVSTITEVWVYGKDWAGTQAAYQWIGGPANLIVVTIPLAPPSDTVHIELTPGIDLTLGKVSVIIQDVTNGPPGHYTLTVGTSKESAVRSDADDASVVATYELTMALDPAGGGTATDMSDESPYEAGTVVSIKAEANAGYRFANWTAAPEVVFDNANAAETTFTMPDEAVTVTANFVEVCQLTISSTTGGSVIAPGEGKFTYDAGQLVSLVAEPDDGYKFVEWTGNVATIDDLNAASTTVITDGDYSITANFEEQEEKEPQSDTTDGCFIATAAYGTPMAEEIEILRDFRDEYLLTSPLGQALVDLYYNVSPPIAEFITEHPALKPIVRAGLVPAIVMSAVVINTTPVEKIAIVGLLVLVSVALAVWAARGQGRLPKYP